MADEQFKMDMPDAFVEEAEEAERLRLAEQARLEENLKQKEIAEQQKTEQVAQEKKEDEEPGFFEASPQYEYLEALPDNPIFTPMATGMRVSGSLATGVIDTAMDTTSFLLPWLKPVDDWWEEVSYRKETTGFDKAVRDIGGFMIPMLGLRGAAMKGIGALAKTQVGSRLGMTGLTKGLPGLLTNIGVTESVSFGLSATNDNTREPGNVGTLIETASDALGLGIQVPWASRDGDSEDTIYWKNMFEEAGLSGVSAMLDLTFSKYGVGSALKALDTVLKPKSKIAKEAIEASSLGTVAKSIDPVEKIKFKEAAIESAQTDEAVKRMVKIDEAVAAKSVDGAAPEPAYDAFVNEPHVAPDRAMQDAQADPIAFKAGVAKIKNNAGTVNGRPKAVVTDYFKNEFLDAPDGSTRGNLLDEVAKKLDPEFDIKVGDDIIIPASKVEASLDELVTKAFNEPEDFKEEFNKLSRDAIKIYGEYKTPITDPSFKTASDAALKILDLLDPIKQRASAAINTQLAGNVTDAARASELLDANGFRNTRQQELGFQALATMLPEIGANQTISGTKLLYKKLLKERKAKGLPIDGEWEAEKLIEFDEKLAKSKQDAIDFADEALKILREKPQFFAPLMREFIKSGGDVNTIEKLGKLAVKRISFWKKAFINGEPEIPSLLVQQIQTARYNHVLTGKAPIKAVAGAATGLIGKPITAFAGAAARGDVADFKRAMFVYGGVSNNIKKAFNVMAQEWKYALESPEKALARGRKDYAVDLADQMQTMEEMADIWRENNEYGKVAVWNLTRVLSNYNGNPIVRFGLNAMTAIDGFSKSMSASFSANSRAYADLFAKTNGAIDEADFLKLSDDLYRKSFDAEGILQDDIANYAAGEINLNLDSELVNSLEGLMKKVPAAKAVFMFPRTGLNALKLAATFSPTGVFGQSIGKAREVFKATTQLEIDNVLFNHGYKAGDMAAFNALKSEYTGRQLMGSAVTLGAAMWAMEGNLTGSGPGNNAQLRRMRDMGVFKPFSFKDPITGEWRSYQGIEPFDTYLGLVADIVYNADRMDQAVTEDFLRTVSSSISLNITQKSFLSGFEPLAKIISGDQGAWNRFVAMNTDSLIPGTGIRSILNNAISPALKDIDLSFGSYMANRNKSIPGVGDSLANSVDAYTGEPINYMNPMMAAINSILPFGKSNGGMEPWRQKLLRSGWSNLSTMRTHPRTGEPLTPDQREAINTYTGQTYKLGEKIEELFNNSEGWWDKKLEEYKKERGLNKQKDFPIKKTLMHRMLDTIHKEAFDAAFNHIDANNPQVFSKAALKDGVNKALESGDMKGASKILKNIQQMPK